MIAERVIDCMGMIDERFIIEAERYAPKPKRINFAPFVSIAACACVAVTAAVLIGRNADIPTVPDDTIYSITEALPLYTFSVTEQNGETAPEEGTLQHGDAVAGLGEGESESYVTTSDEFVYTETLHHADASNETTQSPSTETAVRVSETTLGSTETTESSEGGSFMHSAGGYEYDETLAGISFRSYDHLREYLEARKRDDEEITARESSLEQEIRDYLSSAKGVYVIEDVCPDEYEHVTVSADDINEILITPTYTETYFSMYGAKMQLSIYNSDEAGKTAYDYGVYMYENEPDKAGRFDIYDGSYAFDKFLYTVYGYETPLPDRKEFNYVWVQDGKYFSLRVNGKNHLADSAHCKAKFIPFN